MATPVDLMRQIAEAFNERRIAEVAPTLFAPEFVRHDLTDLFPGVEGVEGVQDFLGSLVAAMPDVQVEILDAFGVDDRATIRFVITGTHTGTPMLGVPATGRRVEIRGINIYRIDSGRIVETWQLADGLGIYRQLGLL